MSAFNGARKSLPYSRRLSGQLDIIVEWPFFASFPAPLGTQRLYLAEAIAFVIEVKSDLRSQVGTGRRDGTATQATTAALAYSRRAESERNRHRFLSSVAFQ